MITYPIRRLGWWIRAYESACNAKWCARPRSYQGVLASVWCDKHNARIMAGESTEGWTAGITEDE